MLIDTHKAIQPLGKAGANDRLAEAIVSVVTSADDKVATAEDISRLQQATSEDMALLRQEMETLREDLTLKMYAVGGAVIAAMAAFNFIG